MTADSINIVLRVLDLLIIPLAVWLYKFLSEWRAEAKDAEAEAQRMRTLRSRSDIAMMKDKIMQSGKFFCMLGSIPCDVKENLLEIGKAYEAIGGNGKGHDMIEAIKELPVDDTVLDRWHKLQYKEGWNG